MNFRELLHIVSDEPIFETALLLAGNVKPTDVQRQLTRWVESGRIYQLRRGLYSLAPPFQKVQPHPFLVANKLVRASYVSGQSALAYYGLIPEFVPATTSVTTQRPGELHTPLGAYLYRHVNSAHFGGYHCLAVAQGQSAFVATREKALLDLIYLEPGADQAAYLGELRLQNLGQIDLGSLHQVAERLDSPKLLRAVGHITRLARTELTEFEAL